MFASRRIATTFIKQKRFSTTSKTINFLTEIHPVITTVGMFIGMPVGGYVGLCHAYEIVNHSRETTLIVKFFDKCVDPLVAFMVVLANIGCGGLIGALCFGLYPITIPICIYATYQHYADKSTEIDDDAKN